MGTSAAANPFSLVKLGSTWSVVLGVLFVLFGILAIAEPFMQTQRDVLESSARHCGRASGSRRFSRVNHREGSTRKASSDDGWLPGRCGLLRKSFLLGRTGRWPP